MQKLYSSVIVIACLAVSAPAQRLPGEPKQEPRNEVELERYGDPPAEFTGMFRSPGLVMRYGPFTITQVNVNGQGQNILGDAANEPSIVVDPTNPNRMAIGWRQFDSVTSNFRQGGWGYTTNGGLNWTFPGILETNVFRSDPVLGSDADGNFYYLSLKQTFYDDLWQSPNFGQTWVRLADATGGDKQWMTIDTTNSTGRGFIYQAWSTSGNNYQGRQFSRTTNGGASWMNPINIPLQPVWGTLDVASDGTLYIGGCNFGSSFYCIRSSNAKNSAVTPTFDQSVTFGMGGSIAYSKPINPDGLVGQSWLCVDRSGGPTNGYVYMLASVVPSGSLGSEVRFARSTNGGASFSSSTRVNDGPVNTTSYRWMGTLSCAPNGRLDVIWLDTRNDMVTNRLSHLRYTYSLDGGLTWATSVAVTPDFDPSLGYPNQNKMGDYMTLVSDTTGANVAFCATFNGEEDIYHVRVAPQPISLPPTEFAYVAGVPVSGGLSQVLSSDNQYLIGRPGPVFANSVPPLQISFGCTAPTTNPQAITMKVEASASSTAIQQKIYLLNVQTSQYEELDARQCTLGDQVVTVSPSGSMARFVNQSTRKVTGLVSFKQTAALFAFPWNGNVDQVLFTATP
jgi:hypothetical protein